MKAALPVLLGLILSVPSFAQNAPSTAPAAAPSPATAPAVQASSSGAADQIRVARDPSGAIEAYARSVAAHPMEAAEARKAFIRRMVDLGAPELADAQAQETLRENPSDSMALAVTAFVSAARGQPPVALEQIAAALKQTPGEPFVQRTAAQVVAWFDSNPSQLTDAVKPTVDWIKQHFSGLAEYSNAHAAAMQAPPQTGETTQPATTTTSGPKVIEYRNGQVIEAPQSYNDMEPASVPDYYGSYYPSYYPSPYYGGVGYYYYPSPIFFTNPFHCHFIHHGGFVHSQPFHDFHTFGNTAFGFGHVGARGMLNTRSGFVDGGGFRTFSSPAPRFDSVPMRVGRSQDFRGQTMAPAPQVAPSPAPTRSAPAGSGGSFRGGSGGGGGGGMSGGSLRGR